MELQVVIINELHKFPCTHTMSCPVRCNYTSDDKETWTVRSDKSIALEARELPENSSFPTKTLPWLLSLISLSPSVRDFGGADSSAVGSDCNYDPQEVSDMGWVVGVG